MPNGQVINNSTRTLWVVETDSGRARAHRLEPSLQSPSSVDADGFQAVALVTVDGHWSWVKINDLSTATVTDKGSNLTSNCIFCRNVQDGEFGPVTWDDSPGWGERIT